MKLFVEMTFNVMLSYSYKADNIVHPISKFLSLAQWL